MACMTIKITKKALLSLLGEDKDIPLKPFTGLLWSQDGMVLSSRHSLFRGSLVVKINWPCELAKHKTNRENLNKALAFLFAQVDEKYINAVKEKQKKEKEDAAKGKTPTPAPAK